MKKGLLITCMVASIAACSSNSDSYYQRSNNSLKMPGTTTVSVASLNNFSIPDDGQAVREVGSFRVINNIYDASGEQVVIPRNSIISGLYTNDGASCIISWKSVYANIRDYNEERALFSIQNMTDDSSCIPAVGVQKGNRIPLRFE